MAFLNSPRFPDEVAYGLQGGPSFNVGIFTTSSGAEVRHARNTKPQHRYDAAFGIKRIEALYEVRSFFHVVGGQITAFRFKDWFDFTTAADGVSAPDDEDHQIGTGNGSNTQFQLVKIYTAGSMSRTRVITKPVEGTVVVAVDGTPATFTVDTTTGIVTITGGAPTNGAVVSAGCEFDVPVRFGNLDEGTLFQSYDSFDAGQVPSIPLVEVLEEVDVPSDFVPGHAVERSLTVDLAMSPSLARFYVVSAPGSGRSVTCPNPSSPHSLPGGHYFTVVNVGANSVAVKSHSGSTLVTLTTNQGVDVLLGEDNSGGKFWFTL
jgi:uncharacterized protein (TIGR02217 family)